jgi:hypothetical protein
MTVLMTGWCNAYGAENPGGANNLSGFDSQPVRNQWICDRPAPHRFVWVCEHGHKGEPFHLCEHHHAEFTSASHYPDGHPVPFTLKRQISFCPRCNTESDHKCSVRLEHVS